MTTDCTCFPVANPWTYYGIVEPGGALEPDPYCIEHFPPRWKLACINWTSPAPVPRVMTYLNVAGAAYVTRYWPTWADAVEWLDKNSDHLDLWGRTLQATQRGIDYGEDD